MAHELDFSKGKAAIAYRGETPWHGHGQIILPQDSIDDIRIKAGLDYDVVKTPVLFGYQELQHASGFSQDAGSEEPAIIDRFGEFKQNQVLYRNDTHTPLSVVGEHYRVVQPKEVVEFYRDLCADFGFEVEVVGALAGGRKVWALANTKNAFSLRGEDKVKGYLLLATSYDGTMATQARFTSVRVVCNNTLSLARMAKAQVSVPHNKTFDADLVKRQLHVGPAWEAFNERAAKMSERVVSRDEVVQLFMQAYYGLATPDAVKEFHEVEGNDAKVKKTMERLTYALFESPGAQLASARGTLWGALQAVTFDVDHNLPSRDAGSRLNKSWFGDGDGIKNRAFDFATDLLEG